MATRTPLVIVNGQTQQLQPGDAIAQTYGFPYAITSNTIITAGYGVDTSTAYPVAISAGVTLAIGAASVLSLI